MIVSTEAIVLYSRKYSETSKIVSLYTRQEGKLAVIAKGARRAKNKFGSSLDPLNYSQISFYKKPNRDIYLLSDAEIIQAMTKIHQTMEHITYGLTILESVSQTQNENEKNEELFNILLKTLILLNRQSENPFNHFAAFQLKLAELSGFGLDLNYDETHEVFRNGDESQVLFSLGDGVSYDPRSSGSKNSFQMDTKALKYLQKLSMLQPEYLPSVTADDKIKSQTIKFFVQYFSYHLEKRFKYRSIDLLGI